MLVGDDRLGTIKGIVVAARSQFLLHHTHTHTHDQAGSCLMYTIFIVLVDLALLGTHYELEQKGNRQKSKKGKWGGAPTFPAVMRSGRTKCGLRTNARPRVLCSECGSHHPRCSVRERTNTASNRGNLHYLKKGQLRPSVSTTVR
jgi:hypothetical protein